MIASWSASAGIAQKIVSRMIIGGSTGLSTMIALPRGVPPSSRTARLVVCVNSSMLARVPGPADLEATDATISAYATGTTDDTACTIGTVAWAPQLIMLMFIASTCSRKFTGGETSGPTARRREVDGDDAGLLEPRRGRAVRLGGRGVEDDLRQLGAGEQPVHALGRRLDPHRPGPLEPVRLDHAHDVLHLDRVAALELGQQVGADVAGTDDGGAGLGAHASHLGISSTGGTFTSVTRLR